MVGFVGPEFRFAHTGLLLFNPSGVGWNGGYFGLFRYAKLPLRFFAAASYLRAASVSFLDEPRNLFLPLI